MWPQAQGRNAEFSGFNYCAASRIVLSDRFSPRCGKQATVVACGLEIKAAFDPADQKINQLFDAPRKIFHANLALECPEILDH
jgi:hypothetical protein